MRIFATMMLVAGLIGCGSQQESGLKDDSSNESIKAFAGELTLLEDGEETGKLTVISLSKSNKATGVMTEEVIVQDHADPENPEKTVATIKVNDDGTMVISEKDELFEGEGEFTAGEAWSWTAWNSQVTTEDGLLVKSSYAVVDGKLNVKKDIIERRRVLASVEGTLEEISLDDYEAKRKAILGE